MVRLWNVNILVSVARYRTSTQELICTTRRTLYFTSALLMCWCRGGEAFVCVDVLRGTCLLLMVC